MSAFFRMSAAVRVWDARDLLHHALVLGVLEQTITATETGNDLHMTVLTGKTNHLSSWVFQDPSREMAQTARLQPGSCQVLPPGLKPPGVSQPADDDCLDPARDDGSDCLDPARDDDSDCLDRARDSECICCPIL